MKFACQTVFDLTPTGITGHFKNTRMPFVDQAGQLIDSQESWNRARNQQRNLETIVQILSLRTQVFNVTDPIKDYTGTRWMFEFETETAGAFGSEDDPVQVLHSDAQGVPMLRDVDHDEIEPFLVTTGPRQNIWFSPVFINTK